MVLHKVLASAIRALTLVLYLGALSMHLHAGEAAAATADLPACLPGHSTHGPAKQPPRADWSGLHATSTQVACKEPLPWVGRRAPADGLCRFAGFTAALRLLRVTTAVSSGLQQCCIHVEAVKGTCNCYGGVQEFGFANCQQKKQRLRIRAIRKPIPLPPTQVVCTWAVKDKNSSDPTLRADQAALSSVSSS